MKGNARAENSWENLLDDGLHVSLQVDDILEWRVTSRQTRSPRAGGFVHVLLPPMPTCNILEDELGRLGCSSARP